MLQIAGAPALSAFRIAKLLERVKRLEPSVQALASRFIHFVDLTRELQRAERDVLERLLTYGPRSEPLPSAEDNGQILLVVPREGTISPWSSKATDIAHVCGLDSVQRIERGVLYTMRSTAPLAASSSPVSRTSVSRSNGLSGRSS